MKIIKTANYKKAFESPINLPESISPERDGSFNLEDISPEGQESQKEEKMKKALDLIFENKKDVSQAFEAVFSHEDLFNGTVKKLYNRVKQDPRYLR